MTGQFRETGERIQFSYEQSLDHDNYSVVIGNESFTGKAVMDGATSSFGTAVNGGNWVSLLTSTSTNRFVAVLLGDKGNTLNCVMNYADSSGFTAAGGVGLCKHSDGRLIDIVW